MEKKILVLDIETTGFSHKKDCILELGAVVLDTETGKTRKAFNATFKEKHLSGGSKDGKKYNHTKAWIFDNSDMTLDEIRNSEDIEFYREDIQKLLTKYAGRITAWNRDFDAGFLEDRGFDLGETMGCPMKLTTDFFGLKQKNGKTPKWASVPEAAVSLGIVNEDFVEAHRGLEDARLEASIIYMLIKKGEYNG